MQNIKEIFTQKQNIDLILNTSISNIFNRSRIILDINNEILFNCFNNIASKVFNYESKKPNCNLLSLNNIVINELTNFITENYNDLPFNKEIINPVKDSSEIISEVKEIIKEIHLQHESNILNLENVKQIKLINLYMYNEDYIINENNNKLVYRKKITPDKELYSDWITILLPLGYYTTQNNSLIQKLNELCKDFVVVTKNEFNGTVNFKSEIPIEFDLENCKGLMCDILGFSNDVKLNTQFDSMYPLKLIKRKNLNLKISIEDESIVIPLILEDNYTKYDLKSTVIGVNGNIIKEINLDFDNFNHRNYPFTCVIEVTFMKLI